MKKSLIRTVSAALLSACMVFSCAITTMAADQADTVELNLYAQKMEYVAGKDKFFDFSGVVPGDTMLQKIVVHNRTNEPAVVHLKATPTSGSEKWLELMKKIELVIYPEDDPGRILYAGDLTGSVDSIYGNTGGAITAAKNLGTVRANSDYTLVLHMTVPITMGNDFALVSTGSGIQWSMNALFDTVAPSSSSSSPSGGSSIGGGNSSRGYDNDRSGGTDRRDSDRTRDANINIPDTTVPKDNYTIVDDEVPLRELPKTGSDRYMEYGITMFASVVLLAAGAKNLQGEQV